MHDSRFSLALDWLKPTEWELFEQLASAFLASEFPELRTTASASGDGGRDSFFFVADGDPTVALQYSVTKAWEQKITSTVTTLGKKHPETRVLIYATNQVIGAKADELVAKLRREEKIHVDVRDRHWFLERRESSVAAEKAAENLALRIVDPVLQDKKVIERRTPVLGNRDARTAVLYLDLQLRDDAQDKGLTTIAFDGLVRAALRDTDPDHRLSRADVQQRVLQFVPGHDVERIKLLTDSALDRMKKRSIRHHEKADEFCLAFDERRRLLARVAELEDADRALSAELESLIEQKARRFQWTLPRDLGPLVQRCQRVLNRLLLEKGEDFVEATRTGRYSMISEDHLHDFVTRDVGSYPGEKSQAYLVPLVTLTLQDVLLEPRPGLREHLRSMADAYTLFAFLRETPDVQKVVQQMFAQGDIWLDTTMVLPVFIEQLLEPDERRYTSLLAAARQAGMKLWIIPGVLDEINHHITNSLTCSRPRGATAWVGSVPFLLAAFTWSGHQRSQFAQWVEGFRGPNRPLDDLAEYLAEELGIAVRDLDGEVEAADPDMRFAVEEAWRSRHESRRLDQNVGYNPLAAVEALIRNDVAQYLGVVQRRSSETKEVFGYSSWWLTLDKKTKNIENEVSDRCDCRFITPVMSPDFLVNYLALGPPRQRLPKETEQHLPLMLDVGRYKFVPDELLDEAERIRREMQDQPPRRVRRRLRDRLDEIKAQPGDLSAGGTQALEGDLRERLEVARTPRQWLKG